MKIENLDWDSNLFGYSVGRILVEKNDTSHLKEVLFDSKFRLIYIESESPISERFLYHADTKVVYSKEIIFKNTFENNCSNVIPFNRQVLDYLQIEKLALVSGKYSRFAVDNKFIKNEFEKLYKIWIKKSIEKEIAKEVLVLVENHLIQGFVTIGEKNKDTSDIGLIAVIPDSQGKGYGSLLIKAAENFSFVNNYKRIQVVTQQVNQNAVRLYCKNGFSLFKTTYIYHFWNI